jgi:hypothetical protein
MNNKKIFLDRQTKETYCSHYDSHLFEQYKMYVEMADRLSSRRMLSNSFFVGIHTALITAFTVLLKEDILSCSIVGYAPFIAVLLLCFVWWRILYSYRQLNSGKFKIIHELESRLPVAPYDEEWKVLGRGKNSKLYKPLTHVENLVPVCFAILYLFLAVLMWFQF